VLQCTQADYSNAQHRLLQGQSVVEPATLFTQTAAYLCGPSTSKRPAADTAMDEILHGYIKLALSEQYLATDWTTEVPSPTEAKVFPVASVSRPALRPIQPPVQWVLGVLSPGVKRGRGVTLTTHPI
jgi:hypothetical protein